jgi:hypothetical protein
MEGPECRDQAGRTWPAADKGTPAGTVRCETPGGNLPYRQAVEAVAGGHGFEVIFPEEGSPSRELVLRITTE